MFLKCSPAPKLTVPLAAPEVCCALGAPVQGARAGVVAAAPRISWPHVSIGVVSDAVTALRIAKRHKELKGCARARFRLRRARFRRAVQRPVGAVSEPAGAAADAALDIRWHPEGALTTLRPAIGLAVEGARCRLVG